MNIQQKLTILTNEFTNLKGKVEQLTSKLTNSDLKVSNLENKNEHLKFQVILLSILIGLGLIAWLAKE